MFQIKVIEKLEIHILFPIFFSFENRALYETWKNMVKHSRPKITI